MSDPIEITHIFTDVEFDALLADLDTRAKSADVSVVAIDSETTGLNEYAPTARVTMVQLTCTLLDRETGEVSAGGTPVNYVVPLHHPDSPFKGQWRVKLRTLAHALTAGHRLVGQNLKFDLRWIAATTGVNLTHAMYWDTALGSSLLDENSSASLKPRAAAVFGIERWDDFDMGALGRLGPDRNGNLMTERVPYFQLADYAARDSYFTLQLALWQWDRLGLTPASHEALVEEESREAFQQLRLGRYAMAVGMPSVRALTAIERAGFRLDDDQCERELREAGERSAEATQILTTLTAQKLPDGTGVELLSRPQVGWEAPSGWFQEWSDEMRRAGLLRLCAMTPGGQPSWTKEALKTNIRQGFHTAEHVLTIRQAARTRSYVESWRSFACPDERIRTSYNFYRVVTGRLSSSDPNIQQCPRSLKGCFAATPGNVLITADFSQIELRVIAHISQCPEMIAAYHAGADLHTEMAALIAGCDPSEVSKMQRQNAKACNFGYAYGMKAAKFVKYALDSYDVDVTLEEAELMRAAYFTRWPGIEAWHKATEDRVRRDGFVTSPLGRVRRLPNAQSGDDYLIGEAVRQAYNSPVQSMANDLMLMATDKIRRLHPSIKPVALIHDSVVAECPSAYAARDARAVKDCMEDLGDELRALGVELLVPLVADVIYGPRWGEEWK